jgi:hypothetical protein
MISQAYVDALKIHDPTDPTCRYGLSGGMSDLLGSPAPKQIVRDRARSHGAIVHSRDYQPRQATLTGTLNGDTPGHAQLLLDELKATFRLGAPRVFKYRRLGFSEDEYVTCHVNDAFDAITRPYSRRIPWQVGIICPDPRVYAVALKSSSYDPLSAASGGLLFPLTFPLDFGGSGASTLSVTNQGTIETPLILTVTGPVLLPVITNQTTGEALTTQLLDLLVGETMVLDTDAKTILVNGALHPEMIVAAESTWFDAIRGENLLRLEGTMSAGCTLQADWHDARI